MPLGDPAIYRLLTGQRVIKRKYGRKGEQRGGLVTENVDQAGDQIAGRIRASPAGASWNN